MGKKIIIIIAIIFGVAGILEVLIGGSANQQQSSVQVSPSVAQVQTAEAVTYEGKEGADALTLLKEKNNVEQNSSGLVTSINSRKAEDSKREYWAFYVDGKTASVGPAEYKTKDGEKIEWKIERY